MSWRKQLSSANSYVKGWRRFSVSRRPLSVGFVSKLVYGGVGVSFFAAAAISSLSKPEFTGAENGVPPSAFVWRWTIPATVQSSGAGARDPLEFDDEIDDFLFEDDHETKTQTLFWGSDASGIYLWGWISLGAGNYFVFGLLATVIALCGGMITALGCEWLGRPMIPVSDRPAPWRQWAQKISRAALEVYDYFPKLLLLILIGGIWGSSIFTLSLAIGVFSMFLAAAAFRDSLSHYLNSEYYLNAVEIGLSPSQILFRHVLLHKWLPVIWAQAPFILSAFILYEATLSYLGYGDPWEVKSWGYLIINNSLSAHASWGYKIPLTCLLLVTTSLYLLGDALQERLAPR